MTVKDLIAALSACDGDTQVVVETYQSDSESFNYACEPTAVEMFTNEVDGVTTCISVRLIERTIAAQRGRR